MKKLTLIFGFALIFGLFAFNNDVNGQAVVDHDSQYFLTLGGDVSLPSTYNLVVLTPSGNATFNLEWELSEFNILIPEKGVNKIDIEQPLAGYMVSGTFKIHANGKCKLVLHGEQIAP